MGDCNGSESVPTTRNWLESWVSPLDLPPWMRSFKWIPSSAEDLAATERTILAYLKTQYHGRFVPLSAGFSVNGPDISHASPRNRIWTVSINGNLSDTTTPVVLVHGLGGRLAIWAQNMDALGHQRTVHAFDLLGFGQSSRPVFGTTAETAEAQFVDSIEAWRKEMKLNKFILLSHSLGAYLAASYSLKYPQHIRHLIMVDPWGLAAGPLNKSQERAQLAKFPLWLRAVAVLLQPFNPFACLRLAGPWGPNLIKLCRPDLLRTFSTMTTDEKAIVNYIYHCNAQHPSGESAFKVMTCGFGWSKNPMYNRMPALERAIPVTFICGSESWIDNKVAYAIKDFRNDAVTNVILGNGSGHHVYADTAGEFNDIVGRICQNVDEGTKPP